ncbi:hypothetical protein KA183_14495 [bacterium]|nr:hypothetical protein [bacterium]
MFNLLLILNAGCAWLMTGIIWFVQIVHYPLFASTGKDAFIPYVQAHRHLTSLVVAAPMVIEIVTALMLVFLAKKDESFLCWIAFILVLAIWGCTAFGSIPCHEKLCTNGFDDGVHKLLLSSNWVRTVLWSIRAGLLSYMLYRAMRF